MSAPSTSTWTLSTACAIRWVANCNRRVLRRLAALAALALSGACADPPAPTVLPRPDPGLAIAGTGDDPQRAQDDRAFRRRAARLAADAGLTYDTVCSGRGFLRRLADGPPRFLVLFAHGDSMGFFFHHQNGLYLDTIHAAPDLQAMYGGGPHAAYFSRIAPPRQPGTDARGGAALLTCYGRGPAAALCRALGAPVVYGQGPVGPVVDPADTTRETGAYLAPAGFGLATPAPRGGVRHTPLGTRLHPQAFVAARRGLL